jgi:glycerol-3-phosphate acyltransferase PlsY
VNNVYIYIVGIVVSFLFGGIPFGFIIVKLVKGVDIRTVGSGNIGATNVARVLGKWAFAVVFILDFLKGILPVLLFSFLLFKLDEDIHLILLKVLMGLSAIFGHMFTPYLKFKGGKGVATSCGVFFGLAPLATAVALAVWLVVLGLSRYVSLSSMCAAAALPVAFILTADGPFAGERIITLFCMVAAVLVIVRHASNIRRLLKGTERKVGRKGQNG